MARKGLVFNRDAFRKLRQAPKVQDFVLRAAEAVAADASNNGAVDGYLVTDLVLEDTRTAVSVMAAMPEARRHNRATHALVRAVTTTKVN